MKNKLKKLVPAKARKKLRLLIHKGHKYECPFCHYQSRDLSDIGLKATVLEEKKVVGASRRPGGCYNCGSIDRERLIFTYLQKVYKLSDRNKDLKILHFAPGKFVSKAIRKLNFTDYIWADLHAPGYEYSEYVINMDVLDIPYEDNHFDLIICNHVLEHVSTSLDAKKELYRVLKKGGTAILQVPISKISKETIEDLSITDPKEREAAFGQFDHVRIYGQDYKERLQKAGFKVERINISRQYEKYGLNPEEDMFIGSK